MQGNLQQDLFYNCFAKLIFFLTLHSSEYWAEKINSDFSFQIEDYKSKISDLISRKLLIYFSKLPKTYNRRFL